MAKVYGGLKRILGTDIMELPLDAERLNGDHIDIFNFPKYISEFKTEFSVDNRKLRNLNDPAIIGFSPEQVLELQETLLINQLRFAFCTTPAIYYLWHDIYSISPQDISSLKDFEKVAPITKKHQRLLGWQNFIPAPIAEFYLYGVPHGREIHEIDDNLIIAQEKWTGGTTATNGTDYVQVVIPSADWNASVDTMERLLHPVKDLVKGINVAATSYDMRHIARPIFEAQLRRYGKHLFARPPGGSDEAWIWQIEDLGVQGGVAPPLDHPLKGIGWPGMLFKNQEQFRLALMSSTVPTRGLLAKMLESGMAILNVGGDTGSLPTYFSLVKPSSGIYEDIDKAISEIETLKIVSVAPSLTEIVNPSNLTSAKEGEEGILLQTNFASVWVDKEKDQSFLFPALKTQMIRSSATGNLVKVLGIDKFERPHSFHHQILRYNDFSLDEKLMPVYENPHSLGGTSRGGCAG